MRRLLVPLVLTLASPAAAQSTSALTYAQALAQVNADTSCEHRDFDEVVVYFCRAEPAAWYFTHADADAGPGYFKRHFAVRDGATYMITEAHSDGTDAQQPAFQAWMQHVADSLPQN